MSEVGKYKLSDIARFKYGTMPKKDNMIASGYPIFSGYQFKGYYKTYQYDTHKLIVIARGVGGTGEVRIAPAKCHITNLSIIFDELNECIANEYYLLYYFRKHNLRELDSGSAQSQITIGDLENYVIEIPQLQTQRRIVKVLSAYDNLIENNNRRIATLEEMAQRLYREWFVHFRFPGHENVELVDSELGMIPEGWRVSDVEDNCSVLRRGMSPVYNDNAAGIVINQKCIRDFSINLKLARNQEKTFPAELQVQNGDVLINSTGVGTLGRVAQMYENVPNCTIDSHITLLRPDSSISYYVGSYFREKQAAIMDMGVGSTGQTELNRDKIKVLSLLLPDHDTVCQYEEYVGNLMSLKTQLQKKNMILRKTRDHLLPRLISGDIDVSKIEI